MTNENAKNIMTHTLTTQRTMELGLNLYEVSLVAEAAFCNPTPVMDISTDDEELDSLVQDYEAARDALTEAAQEIADYLDIHDVLS
ncbi:MAG: hypothetical protein GY753_06920 [Gammaproteobacteria bacterium]|nr:hypothetical protein [Gammaproteobacteria bacterium]